MGYLVLRGRVSYFFEHRCRGPPVEENSTYERSHLRIEEESKIGEIAIRDAIEEKISQT